MNLIKRKFAMFMIAIMSATGMSLALSAPASASTTAMAVQVSEYHFTTLDACIVNAERLTQNGRWQIWQYCTPNGKVNGQTYRYLLLLTR